MRRAPFWPCMEAVAPTLAYDHAAIPGGQDLAQVTEHDHAVEERAPPLLGVKGHGAGGGTVQAVSRRARG